MSFQDSVQGLIWQSTDGLQDLHQNGLISDERSASLIHLRKQTCVNRTKNRNAPGFQKRHRKGSSINLSDSHGFYIKKS